MKHPEEYVDLLEQFVESDYEKVKIEGTNREDWVCFIMAAHCMEFPVEVLFNPKSKFVAFRRKVGV